METIVVKLKDKALVLPPEVGKQLGWEPGTKLFVETQEQNLYVRRQELNAKEIARLARIHLAEHVGNATDVKTPIRINGKWRVEAVLSYRPQTIGYMTFTAQGELVEDESDSPAKLRGLSDEN
jgi:antitoxin component of MazEF toxin-antitoxin module